MDDHTPELDGTGEQLEELELEPEVTEPTELGGDPLDEISDETARAEAKKHRAIARRLEKKEETPIVTPEVKAPAPSEFLTRVEFFKSNERKATLAAKADPEVKAHWNEIIPFFTSRRGKETPEDIAEDIQDAITLWKARNPIVPEKDNSVDKLTVTPVVKSGGGGSDKITPKPKDPPNFKLPNNPSDWYTKKS